MSDWLNTWRSIVLSFILIASFAPTYAACSLENDSCLDLPTTSSDQIGEVVSDRSFYEEDALACLSKIVESGCKAVKSVTQFVRKHPLKALTVVLALQQSNSPCRIAGVDALSVTNIDQRLSFDRNGPAVPFLPIMISSQADRLSIDFSLRSRLCDMCSIVSTVPIPPLSMTINGTDSVWRAQGNKISLNTLLSRLFFMPGGTTKVDTIFVEIRELDAPYVTTWGNIVLKLDGSYQDHVVNINQTLVYDGDGQAVRLLPMLITYSLWTQANATIVLGDMLSGTLTSNATVLPQTFTAGTWYIKQSGKNFVENVLANLIFTPAVGYRNIIYLYPTIEGFYTSSLGSITGIITLIPSNSSALVMSTAGQSSATTAPYSSSPSASVSTSQSPVITGGVTSMSTSPESQSAITNSLTSASKSINPTLASPSSSTKPGTSVVETAFTSFSSSATNPIDSSSVDTLFTTSNSDETTTTNELDRSSGSIKTSTNDLPFIIGGALGGAALVGCVVAGIVAYRRKKFSSSQENVNEVKLQLSDKVKDGALVVQPQTFSSSSYVTLPIASPSDQNYGNQAGDARAAIQLKAPNGTIYSFLPEKKRYETLLPRQPEYNEAYSTLHKAAQEGDCYLIGVFLGFEVPVDSIDEEGYTALHLAAQAGHVDACKLLLSRGAHKSLRTKDEKTALMLAQDKGHKQVVALLE